MRFSSGLQHHAMFEKPTIDAFLIDVMVDRGVVEDHHRCQAGRGFPYDLVEELHDVGTYDRGLAGAMHQQVGAENQCTQHRALAASLNSEPFRARCPARFLI